MDASPTARCVVIAEAKTASICDWRTETYTIGIAQAITIDTPAPAGPRTYGTSFNVAAHATSGQPVTVSASGGCAVSGDSGTNGVGDPVTIQMTSGTTACSLTYSRAAYNQYNPAPNLTSSTTAQKAAQSITETQAPPAVANYNDSFTVKATASSGLTVTATGSNGCTGSGTGTGTLITMKASGGQACTVTYSQAGDANYNAAPAVTSTTKVRQTITITQPAPASAAYNDVFVVKATVDSGLAVGVAASGGCTGSGTGAGTTITMNPGGGQACIVTYSQTVGDANYGPATALASTTKVKQTITQTTPAPASAEYNSSFNVAATALSGLPVGIAVAGGCTITGGGTNSATIQMTSGTTACTVTYSQAGDTNFAAVTAPYVVNATKLAQVITFPAQTTPSRLFVNLGTFAIDPLATGGGSGNAITYSSLDVTKCTVSGTTVTMKTVGNCIIAADQAGNANYAAATQTTQIVQLTKALQTINVTVHAPGIKGNGQTFSVTANATPSGLPVSINGYGSCSGSGTGTVTITMTSSTGVCSVVYTQAGDVNYEPANPVTEYVAPDTGGSGCLGEGTYTSLRFSQSGGYIGWACNDGDYIAPGHNISCWPKTYWPWIDETGWSIKPGSGFKGHVLQTALNPGKTFKIQKAPGSGDYYNILNTTDATCIASGNGIYEAWSPRRGSNASAGYLVAFQDQNTMPSGKYCDYSASQTKWKLNFNSGYVTFETAGYPSWPSHGCMGTTAVWPYGLDRVLLGPGQGNYGNWGDTWVRNAAPSCGGAAARMTCGGYQPPPPDHIRFEFNASTAYTCQAPAVTARICSNPMPAIGDSGTCTVFNGVGVITPRSSRGTWAGLTSAPSTQFTGSSTGITLSHTVIGESVDLSYAYPSMSLADPTLECYDTSTNKRVSCTTAMTYKDCPPFDAVEPGAATGTNLYTKLAGTAFDFDVLGISSYTGDATVELVDVSGGAAVCPDSGVKMTTVNFTQPSTVNDSITYTYVAGDNGRKTFRARFDNAAAKVAVRIKDKVGTCFASTDTFTIRPATLVLAASYPASPPVAGVPFTLTATAKNTSNATTTSYTGTPALNTDSITDWTTAAIPGGSLVGSFAAAVAGVATGDAGDPFKYRNVGPVTFPAAGASTSPVGDTTYTAVSSDQANGDCVVDSYANVLASGMYGCNVGSTALLTDRFIPDHYEVNNVVTTACGTATYFGQAPVAAPTVSLLAMSADGFQLTRMLDGYSDKSSFTIEAMDGATSLANPATAAPVSMDLTTPINVWPAVDPGGYYANTASGRVPRPAAPLNYENFMLKTTVTDPDGVKITLCNGAAVGGGGSTTCSSSPTKQRFGILKLDAAYGPETLPVFMPVRALFWNGTKWTLNLEDSCTQLVTATSNPARNIAIGNFKGSLAAADINITAATVTLSHGAASIRIESPGVGVQGSAGVALNLNPAATASDSSCVTWGVGPLAPNVTAGAGLDHLKGNWCGNVYDRDPHATLRFGTPKSQFLYMREQY